MNAYFFNVTKEERENILDQHKHVYDGYVTNYVTNNEMPLFVQDFANDKNGVTVNNKGEIKNYTNFGINEQALTDKDALGVDAMQAVTGQEAPHDEEDMAPDGMDDDSDNDRDMMGEEETDEQYEKVDLVMKPGVKEQVEKSLEMFNRFKKYN